VIGASAIFSEAGLVSGTVGGGLLEARVESTAGEALRDGKARLMSIRLDADPSDREGAICGGTARVLVDPGVEQDRDVFEKALAGLRKRRPGYLVTEIRPAEEGAVRIERNWLSETDVCNKEGDVLIGVALDDFTAAADEPHIIGDPGRLLFIEPIRPLPRLIVAGAGHIGRAVARLGSLLDFSVTVIDDRAEFANWDHVPEADEIVVGEIGDEIRKIEDSPTNYFVIVTRGHQKDAEALRAAIGRPSAYIGMIGSRSKVNIMRSEFLENGWAAAEAWAKVHAPIGLAIGSKTVEEIAVSIAAELVLVRSGLKKAGRGRP
jgi:xanthine dehydrogenase accessory factor